MKVRLLLSILSGALGFLGYVGFNQFYLEWIFLVPVLWSIHDVKPRTAFLFGTISGTIGHMGGFYWIAQTLMDFGDLPLTLAILGLTLLAFINGLSFGFWAWAVRLLTIRSGWSLGWLAPVVWVVMEHHYPFIFPVYIGASLFPLHYVIQIADVTGPLGLSFLVLLANGAVYEAWSLRSFRPVAIAAIIFATVIFYGGLRVQTIENRVRDAPKLTIGLVQTGHTARERNADPQAFVKAHQDMTLELERECVFDLIVWPEYVATLELEHDDTHLNNTLHTVTSAPLMFGCITYQYDAGERRFFGSAILADSEGKILGRYDKQKLVPFGEYVPFSESLPYLNHLFHREEFFIGGKIQDPIGLGQWRLSTTICYESLHANLIREMVAVDPAPHLLVNLTNDSWYGDTHEPLQHLVLASLRAIENRRALVRATNTGISAIVDPTGRLDIRTGQWEKSVLVGEVPMLEGRTFYATFGDWLGWLCMGVVLLGLIFIQRGHR